MISNKINKQIYSIEGISKPLASGYEITFQYPSKDTIKVMLTGNTVDTLVESSNYTIDETGVSPKVVFKTNYVFPEGQMYLTIIRELEPDQLVDLRNGNTIDAEVLEGALDKLTELIQQHDEKLLRAMLSSVSDTTQLVMPDSKSRANMLLGFDEKGEIKPVLTSLINEQLEEAIKASDTIFGYFNSAKTDSELAREWASKLDGPVENTDYSSKYYALESKQVKDAVDTAKDHIDSQKQSVDQAEERITAKESSFNNNYKEKLEAFNDNSSTKTSEFNMLVDSSKSAISSQQESSVKSVTDEGTKQIGLIDAIKEQIDATASTVATNATSAQDSATSASASATRANEYMASAKTYSETATEKAGVATTKATEASSSATSASASAKTAERFAKGTENGTAVTSGDGFEDNAKYYKELAKGYAESIDVSQFATKATTLAGYGITDGATKTEVDNISSSVAPLLYNNAGAHNAIYRGKSLGSTVTDAQWTAIGAGTFDGLYIGDYWTIGNIVYRIAAFDYYYKAGDTSCDTHHVTLVPDTSMYNHVMNDTNVATGAYVGSKMYKEGLAQAKTTISNAFGSAHILTHRQILKNAITGNYESGHSWYDSTVELMTEQNVYGGRVFANFLSGENWSYNYTIDKSQYPLFAFRPDIISNRQWYWLRDVCSATTFCSVSNNGSASSYNASDEAGVRPAFSIKA